MEHGDWFELDHAFNASGNQADHITDLDLRSSPGPKSALDRQWQQLGADILQHIPGERDCSTLFSKHVNPNGGWIRLAAHQRQRECGIFSAQR